MDFTDWLLAPPGATLVTMLLCITISFANSSLNRLLISRFVGWEQYHTIQKELSEYRSQTTQALRAKDEKQMAKLKKREKEIMKMQTKLFKPQMILFGLSFSYILIWLFVFNPTYGAKDIAYVPGYGGIPVFYWYFICSFLFGTLASRLLNILPIE